MRLTTRQASLLPLLLQLSGASAQILSPSNNASSNYNGDGIELGILQQTSGNLVAAFPVAALTQTAAQNFGNNGLRGELLLTDAQNQLALSPRYIALITCDPSSSNLGPDSIFNTAKAHNASAVVLYSTTAQTCTASGFGSYQNVFTFKSLDNSREMLAEVEGQESWAIVATRDVVTGSNGTLGSSSSSNNQQSSLGPSPGTAVAMIILYSITGVITALFLCIIITGAIRAHRHPERYGPRNVIGRPRQTRARGLARAMLESLPIVKVGDRTDQAAKPTDVELENGQPGQGEYTSEQTTATRDASETATNADGDARQSGSTSAGQTGIAAAAVTAEQNTSSAVEESSSMGCSICTEDFEVGEDQRVLPCDHRFHPACIDPWLLNVSGTCPLCRIDLRPAETTDGGEVDENGNSVARDGLAPPLDEGSRGARVRRSIMIGIMGAARPERMSREERVAALRRYREGAAARAEAQRQGTATTTDQPEEESSRRRRYRDLFRIRTRRTGEQETVRQEPAQEAATENSTTTTTDVARNT